MHQTAADLEHSPADQPSYEEHNESVEIHSGISLRVDKCEDFTLSQNDFRVLINHAQPDAAAGSRAAPGLFSNRAIEH
jgi:hypothetical protein